MSGEEYTALTDDEMERFREIRSLLNGSYANADPGLMRARLNGGEVAVIIAKSEDAEGKPLLEAVAVIVNDTVMSVLSPVIPVEGLHSETAERRTE